MLSKLGISVFGKGTINTLHMRCFSAGLQESFEAAQKKVGTLQEDPGNEIKLKLYGLFKQATNGPVTSDSKAPGMFDMVGKAKFGAWKDLGGLKKEEAMRQYAALVNELAGSEDPVPAATGGEAPAAGAAGECPLGSAQTKHICARASEKHREHM